MSDQEQLQLQQQQQIEHDLFLQQQQYLDQNEELKGSQSQAQQQQLLELFDSDSILSTTTTTTTTTTQKTSELLTASTIDKPLIPETIEQEKRVHLNETIHNDCTAKSYSSPETPIQSQQQQHDNQQGISQEEEQQHPPATQQYVELSKPGVVYVQSSYRPNHGTTNNNPSVFSLDNASNDDNTPSDSSSISNNNNDDSNNLNLSNQQPQQLQQLHYESQELVVAEPVTMDTFETGTEEIENRIYFQDGNSHIDASQNQMQQSQQNITTAEPMDQNWVVQANLEQQSQFRRSGVQVTNSDSNICSTDELISTHNQNVVLDEHKSKQRRKWIVFWSVVVMTTLIIMLVIVAVKVSNGRNNGTNNSSSDTSSNDTNSTNQIGEPINFLATDEYINLLQFPIITQHIVTVELTTVTTTTTTTYQTARTNNATRIPCDLSSIVIGYYSIEDNKYYYNNSFRIRVQCNNQQPDDGTEYIRMDSLPSDNSMECKRDKENIIPSVQGFE